MTKIFVGNLPYETDEQELRELFEQFGVVAARGEDGKPGVQIIKNKEDGGNRGIGFVSMESGAEDAIEALHNEVFASQYTQRQGRPLTVNIAQPPKPKSSRPRMGAGHRSDRY